MSEIQFYYLKNGQQQGPVPLSHLQQLAGSGQLKPQDHVWQVGTPDWVPAIQVPGLFPAGAAPRREQTAGHGSEKVMAGPAPGMEEPMLRPRRRKAVPKDDTPPVMKVLTWLGTNIIGVSLLAVLGLLFMCGGMSSFLFSKTESEPTRVSVAELEKTSAKPDKRWLEITGGYLYWDEMVGQTLSKPGETIGKRHIKYYYVPLVSTEVLAEWERTPPDLKLSYTKARVIIKLSASHMEKEFPKNVENFVNRVPDNPHYVTFQPKGTVGSFRSIPAEVVKEMQKMIQEPINKDRMLLLEYEGTPISPAFLGCILLGIGLPLFIPLGIWTYKTVAAPKKKKSSAAARDEDELEDRVTTQPSAAAPAAGKTYYYNRQGQSLGPVSFAQLKQLAASGQLAPQDLVWDDSAQQWVPASSMPGLF